MERFTGLETVAPGYSESNGKVERKHQHLKMITEKFMSDCGCQFAPELWPWFIQAAANAINASWNSKAQGIPADLRRRRLSIKGTRCPFATGDVVNFTYRNEDKSLETGVRGNRIGLFLSENHSGSFSILCVNNERATRFEVHPNAVSHGDQDLKTSVVEYIQWSLGHNDRRFMDHTFAGKLNESKSSNEIEHDVDNNYGPTASQRKRLRRIIPNRESTYTTTRVRKIRATRDSDGSCKRPAIIPIKRKRLVQIIEDHNICIVSTPHKGKVMYQRINNGKLTGDLGIKRLSELSGHDRKFAVLSKSGKVLKINEGAIKREQRPFYHPDIGYIGPDEARPDAILRGDFKEADIKEMRSYIENGV